MSEGFKKCTTVKELKEAIKDLPDDMVVGKWDGDYDCFYDWANGAPSTLYLSNGHWTPYNWSDDDNPDPTKTVLSL